ncbi:MAG: DNA cytosine methyltransferase [Mediterraneibacter sp.]
MKVLDVFSGAGGFSLGFQLAGYDIIGAIEIDKWAAETFQRNHPSAKVLIGDIVTFSDEYLKKVYKERPDVIVGGPPCQGFSVCNKNAGDPKDPRNSLFTEFLRTVKVFEPSVVVMENVPNIIKAKTNSGEKVIDIIIQELKEIGYYIKFDVLSASDYGVPQKRKRLILVGTKRKIDPFPEPTHYVREISVGGLEQERLDFDGRLPCPVLWDAISDLPDIEACEGAEEMDYTKPAENDYQRFCRKGSSKVYNHLAMKHSKRIIERFSKMTWGQSISDIKEEHLKQRKRNGNGAVSDKPYDQNNRRMYPFDICNTITASFYGNFVHPYKNRNFTAREGARIQSFPDWYVFYGKPTVVSRKLALREGRENDIGICQYGQIGNAVPPLLARAIAKKIKRELGEE